MCVCTCQHDWGEITLCGMDTLLQIFERWPLVLWIPGWIKCNMQHWQMWETNKKTWSYNTLICLILNWVLIEGYRHSPQSISPIHSNQIRRVKARLSCFLTCTDRPFIHVSTCLLAPPRPTGRPVRGSCRVRENQERETRPAITSWRKTPIWWMHCSSQTRYSSGQKRQRNRRIWIPLLSEGAASVPHELVQRENSPTFIQHWFCWGLLLAVP